MMGVSDPLKAYARSRTADNFAAVVRAYQLPVYNTALRITADPGAAEDVAQSVFVALLDGKVPGDLESERAWVYRTAVNAALHWNRDGKNRRTREQESARAASSAPPADEAVVRNELAERALEALSALPEELRSAVTLRVLQGLSYAEAGTALGAPTGTVVDRVRQGLEKIRGRFLSAGVTLTAADLESALGQVPPSPVPTALAKTLTDLAPLANAAPAAGGLAMSATMKTAAVGVAALGLGLLGGRRMAQPPLPPPPPVAASAPAPPAQPSPEALALRSELQDARAQVELLKKEIAEQDRRRQGLEAQLAEARQGVGGASRPRDTGPAIEDEEEKEPEWKHAIYKQLRSRIHFKFDRVPFKECKEYLAMQGRIVIHVDKQAYDAVPGLDDKPILLASPEDGMSLESALSYLTKSVDLAWTLRDESIVITTEAGAKEPPELRQYDLRDLLTAAAAAALDAKRHPGITRPTTDVDFVDFIKKHVDASVWTETGNSVETQNGRLFVTAPPATLRKVRDVLKGFREQISRP